MAVSLQSAGLVRQKTRAITLDPAAFYTLKAFFLYWSSQKQNADLQLIPFTEALADADDGSVLLSGASTLYFVYAKKNSSATDAYLKFYDDATNDGTAGDQILAFPLFLANETVVYWAPQGHAFATGIVVTQHTTSIGVTDASEGGSGFVIVGA